MFFDALLRKVAELARESNNTIDDSFVKTLQIEQFKIKAAIKKKI